MTDPAARILRHRGTTSTGARQQSTFYLGCCRLSSGAMKEEDDDNDENDVVVIDGLSLEDDIKRFGITSTMGDIVIPPGGGG